MIEKRGNLLMGFIIVLVVLFMLSGIALAKSHVFTGVVVGVEPKIIRVRGKDGTISVFWVGRKTHWKSGRIPHIGEKVRIKYVKDRLHRNAVVQLTIIKK
jgi:hypothetical protein